MLVQVRESRARQQWQKQQVLTGKRSHLYSSGGEDGRKKNLSRGNGVGRRVPRHIRPASSLKFPRQLRANLYNVEAVHHPLTPAVAELLPEFHIFQEALDCLGKRSGIVRRDQQSAHIG